MSKNITTHELREKYLQFFESKGHTRIPSAPLVPENDPSVLFTTAGMHPLVPYLKGQPHPAGNRLVDAQKCLRTTDIDEVGDGSHATVFEMLGNWSLGSYFKKEAITWSWEFLTSPQWLGLNPDYLAFSVFQGDDHAPRDEESADLWKSLGIADERIAYLDKEENWWPAGGKQSGPQGPDTEMFYWIGADAPPLEFDPENSNWVEIWNDVFMQYNRTSGGTYEDLPQKNVDTGMGLERTVMILNGLTSIYEIDTFEALMQLIDAAVEKPNERNRRILADHIKAFTFVLGDEVAVIPSNTDQGYVARRLIRRAIVAARSLGVENISNLLLEGVALMTQEYRKAYPSLAQREGEIAQAVIQEMEKFSSALQRGIDKMQAIFRSRPNITGPQAFELFATYGLPIEVIQELAQEQGGTVDIAEFEQEMRLHQKKSRAAADGKFKGGLADHSKESIHYHTATHLLHQALRETLGDHVVQKGSNITPKRLRFDFLHPEKMTPEQLKTVEDLVNQKIAQDLPVEREEMTVEEAKEQGALGLFEHKYSEKVSVYRMGTFSCEICGGPHVEHTGVLGHFKIKKEESASAGVRRIKAILE